MILHDREELDFDDVMMLPLASNKEAKSRDHVDLNRTFAKNPSRGYEWVGVPIIAANMDTVGTFEMAEALMEHNCCTAIHKHYGVDELITFFKLHEARDHLLFYTMGIGDKAMRKLMLFSRQHKMPRNICIDVANGYMPHFAPFVTEVRKLAPDSIIMAGNVTSGDHTQRLINAGASIVKVGIGSGSACTTRRMTGVGRPQFSAIMDCARAAHAVNGLICSDGGCVHPGDIPKAIGAGADFVMLGGMLAGHDESGGKKITKSVPVMVDEYYSALPEFGDRHEIVYGKTYPKDATREVMVRQVQDHTELPVKGGGNKIFQSVGKFKDEVVSVEFYGMSSDTAMEKHNGGVANYKASEGRTLTLPYRGPVKSTMETILGGIRSNMMYIGAEELKHVSKCAEFIKVRRQLNTSLTQYES
jgi:GMP reductase